MTIYRQTTDDPRRHEVGIYDVVFGEDQQDSPTTRIQILVEEREDNVIEDLIEIIKFPFFLAMIPISLVWRLLTPKTKGRHA